MQVSAFWDSLGVVTHLGADPYNDPQQLHAMLSWIGIDNIRQNAPGTAADRAALITLGQLGAKINLLINGNGPVSLAGALADIAAVKPYVAAVEGPNEVNLFPISYNGLTGIQAAIAFQHDLDTAIRADPSLAGVPVYTFSLGGILPADVPGLSDLSNVADYANIHSYAPNGIRPSWVIPASVDGMARIAASDPVVLTETGYYTLPGNRNWGGVSETVAAKYELTEAFENFKNGIARTYFYDLIDDAADPAGTNREAHFGFYHYDGTPKVSATAFHNLSTILADSASTPAATTIPLSYSVQGLPWTGGSMILNASDGRSFVVLWNDVGLWNNDTASEIAANPQSVTLTISQTAQSLRVFDPLLGTAAVQSSANTATITLSLVDHPIIVEITPQTASTPVGTGTTSPATATSVFRFFSASDGTQFLTSSAAERDSIIATRPDLVYEGVGLSGLSNASSNVTDPVAVYRLFNMRTGAHFYTASAAERDQLGANGSGYVSEGVAFYEQGSSANGFVPVYRFFDTVNGTHFYTSNGSERATMLASRPDLTPEGIVFYAPS